MNGTKEIAGGFVIARSDTPVLLEFGKEALNQMTRLVHMSIVFAWLATSRTWWNLTPLRGARSEQTTRIPAVAQIPFDQSSSR
jgi:hypothetical protein